MRTLSVILFCVFTLFLKAFAGAMDRASIQFDLLESNRSVAPQDAINVSKDIMSRKNSGKISYLSGGIFTQAAYTTEEYLIRQKDSELALKLAWQALTVRGVKKVQVTYSAALSYPAQPSFAHVERSATVAPGETIVITDAETPQGMADTRPVVVALRVDLITAHYAYPRLGGIGAGVAVNSGVPIISSVLPGGAAQKAGLVVGDELREIDGRSTIGMKLEDLIRIVKGDPGTLVVLQVYHPSQKAIDDISIIRDLVEQ
jgi:hypothetical protein